MKIERSRLRTRTNTTSTSVPASSRWRCDNDWTLFCICLRAGIRTPTFETQQLPASRRNIKSRPRPLPRKHNLLICFQRRRLRTVNKDFEFALIYSVRAVRQRTSAVRRRRWPNSKWPTSYWVYDSTLYTCSPISVHLSETCGRGGVLRGGVTSFDHALLYHLFHMHIFNQCEWR